MARSAFVLASLGFAARTVSGQSSWDCSPSSRPNNLPVVATTGSTPYEHAFNFGSATALQIQAAFAQPGFVTLKQFIQSNSTVAAVSAALLNNAKAACPWCIDEMQGLADGAGVAFDDVFLVNSLNEIQTLQQQQLPPTTKDRHLPTHCTDLLFIDPTEPGTRWIVHNEDNDASVPVTNFTYMGLMAAQAQTYVGDEARAQFVDFWSYQYPGGLTTMAFGFNSAGLWFSENAVFPTIVNASGVPVEIIQRLVMNCKSLDEAIALLQSIKPAGGFSANMMQLNDPKGNRVVNVEISPQGLTSVVQLTAPGAHYAHVNLYQHSSPNINQFGDASSTARLARLKQMGAPQNASDLLLEIGDTANPVWPIWRNGSESDAVATLMTVAVKIGPLPDGGDGEVGSVFIYPQNPKYCPPLSLGGMNGGESLAFDMATGLPAQRTPPQTPVPQ
jgi:Acyl-coenzyme A:6-aminopenicillanic acid acyl-transferase